MFCERQTAMNPYKRHFGSFVTGVAFQTQIVRFNAPQLLPAPRLPIKASGLSAPISHDLAPVCLLFGIPARRSRKDSPLAKSGESFLLDVLSIEAH